MWTGSAFDVRRSAFRMAPARLRMAVTDETGALRQGCHELQTPNAERRTPNTEWGIEP
jgi:hypothetical protein